MTWVVVLAGGVGSRFWPLSTPSRPKQLLPLVGREPLLVETLDRLAPLVERAEVVVPGHGPPLSRDRARELLALDRRYVARLEDGPLRGPTDHRQQRIHADNLRKHQGE